MEKNAVFAALKALVVREGGLDMLLVENILLFMMKPLGGQKLVQINYTALGILSSKHLFKCTREGFSFKGHWLRDNTKI